MPDIKTASIVLIAYLVALWGGHLFVLVCLKRFALGDEEDEEIGFPGAGALIGFLERALALTFVLINSPMALAVIFAAKSITRFKALQKRRFAEYYLIGTLSSILFALLVGLVTIYYLKGCTF